jgi:hypothetical protein
MRIMCRADHNANQNPVHEIGAFYCRGREDLGKVWRGLEPFFERVRLVASDLHEISLRQGRTLVVKSKRPSGSRFS